MSFSINNNLTQSTYCITSADNIAQASSVGALTAPAVGTVGSASSTHIYTPVAPIINNVDKDVMELPNMRQEDVDKLHTNLQVGLLAWNEYSPRKNVSNAVKVAIPKLMGHIDELADRMKAMGYTEGLDSCITTLKNYYTAMLNALYDDDNKFQRKGEICDMTFTYKDASGKTHTEKSNFVHYAFNSWKKIGEHQRDCSRAESGIVLSEKWGLGHAYYIDIDMNFVVDKLVELYNAL